MDGFEFAHQRSENSQKWIKTRSPGPLGGGARGGSTTPTLLFPAFVGETALVAALAQRVRFPLS